ncbi:Uncharacterised protein [Mycobacteroides abscessus subsp. abscessus]|nr:Uncharacterised protein [Mycobacteroides abscessus subsp. abscessus]
MIDPLGGSFGAKCLASSIGPITLASNALTVASWSSSATGTL